MQVFNADLFKDLQADAYEASADALRQRTMQENASKKVLGFQVVVRWLRVEPGGFLRVVRAVAGVNRVLADW